MVWLGKHTGTQFTVMKPDTQQSWDFTKCGRNVENGVIRLEDQEASHGCAKGMSPAGFGPASSTRRVSTPHTSQSEHPPLLDIMLGPGRDTE